MKELPRTPASRIVRREGAVDRPAGAPQPAESAHRGVADEEPAQERPVFREPWWARVRWGLTLTIAAIAFATCVAFATLPELLPGQSLTSDRGTTFFSNAPKSPQPAPTTQTVPVTILIVTITTPTATTTTTTTTGTQTAPTPAAPTTPAVPTATAPVPPTAPPP